jgi:hypothetical protein
MTEQGEHVELMANIKSQASKVCCLVRRDGSLRRHSFLLTRRAMLGNAIPYLALLCQEYVDLVNLKMQSLVRC